MKLARSGVEIRSDKLIAFGPVLKTWVNLINRYSDAFPDTDAAYWYNERSSTSVLAAAAWATSNKWMALEEFSTEKRDGKGGRKYGRCDLYCSLGNHEISFAFEAKQSWQRIGKRVSNRLGDVEKKFQAAKDDVRKLKRAEGAVKAAVCFVCPRIPVTESHEAGSVEKCLGDWLVELKQGIQWDALAWVFPKSSVNLEGPTEYLHPGVCMLFKVRK